MDPDGRKLEPMGSQRCAKLHLHLLAAILDSTQLGIQSDTSEYIQLIVSSFGISIGVLGSVTIVSNLNC